MTIKRKINDDKFFGKKIAELRNAKGMTQKELAEKIGTSQRMVVHYECHSKHVPTKILLAIATTLRVSTDELLGIKQQKDSFKPKSVKLWQQLRDIEKLSPQDQKSVLKYMRALLK